MTIETEDGTAAETPDPAERDPLPAPRRRFRRPLALLLAVTFFFGPAVAFVFGERPQAIENRKLAAFPSVSAGWDFFPQFATWATDHLPLRKQAVEGNAALTERVFDEPPSYGGGDSAGVAGVPGTGPGTDSAGAADAAAPKYPPVIQGTDGWLYYGGDVSGPCQPTRTVADTLTRLNRLATAVESSGRKFVFVIAPDKSTAWPQNLPETYLGKACAAARKDEFWTALRASPPPGYVDLRGAIEAEQKTSGTIYRKTDTHWGQQGALQYAKVVADALQPTLWRSLTVTPTGDVQRPGDLGVLLGRPQIDTVPSYRLSRPGADGTFQLPTMPLTNPVQVLPRTPGAASTGGPAVRGSVLLLGDSFTNSSSTMIPPLFTDLTILHNEAAAGRPETAATAMAKSDVVVFEIVERTIASGRGALIEDRTLTAIEKALAASPR